MATKLTVPHPLYPESTISLALFRGFDANEGKCLRETVMKGQISVTLLKTNMIIDPLPVLVAANKAVHFNKIGGMTTRSVNSEILYCYSPTKNISESFKSYGMADTDTSVLVVILDDSEDKVLSEVGHILKCEPSSLDKFAELADEQRITKAYKVTPEELKVYSLAEALVSRISAKEIITAGKGNF